MHIFSNLLIIIYLLLSYHLLSIYKYILSCMTCNIQTIHLLNLRCDESV